MKPLNGFPYEARRRVEYVLTDIDGTLTLGRSLPAVTYLAMEKLRAAGLRIVPVTGCSAGWCDLIARMWPVDGVVGEGGGFYFRYDEQRQMMIRRYWKDEAARRADRRKMECVVERILTEFPGARIAADTIYRETDFAIDYAENEPCLPMADVERIVALFRAHGATANYSSIHVNAWFGDYNKLSMSLRMFREVFGLDLDAMNDRAVFVGDSLNDVTMFRYFTNAVAVANIADFVDQMPPEARPKWVTDGQGGYGFAELADALLKGR